MLVTSNGIKDGMIEEKYGGRGTQFDDYGTPNCSIPLKIEGAPTGTKSYAIVIEDKDAYPISGGFVWFHWLLANLTRNELFENESISAKDFIQGCNSWFSQNGREASSFYGGMAPPDAPHLYEIHVYALDILLDLNNSFYLNELYHKMDRHILESYTLKGIYKN